VVFSCRLPTRSFALQNAIWADFFFVYLQLPPLVSQDPNQDSTTQYKNVSQRTEAAHRFWTQTVITLLRTAQRLYPRNQKHRGLMRVINNAAKVAGLQTRYEPDTHSLLLGEFSKADCRRVFPKAMSKYKAGFEKVSQAADFIASVNCTLSPVEKQNLIQSQIDLLPLHQGEYVGLRVDLCIENPDTGETKWVDTTVVHTTSASYENKELKAIAKKNL
jgi:hypothetical protein